MTRYATRLLSSTVLAAMCFSPSLSGADDVRCSPRVTSTPDVEGNGHLTATAHQAAAAKRFELIDTNKDGKVTADEVGASRGAESIAWAGRMTSTREKIAELDTNKDGALTPKEYAESSQRVFSQLDTDHDGVLSDSEMLNAYKGSHR